MTKKSKSQSPNNVNANIEKILLTLRELQKIDKEFPIQYAICLIEIALNESISLTELAKKTGIALSTISRISGALSNSRQKGVAYKLIDIKICQSERRKKELYLTAIGKNVINRISAISATA
ncbi:MarR family transcriptional regulator [Alphaproteobacteria bacterium]|nr:MarR family transcriptional regulator [Alphaproteobacteria bacterium]